MFKGSWRTSAVGFLGGVSLLITQVVALLDSDPATVFSVEQVIAALALLGVGWFARDKNVTSEQQGLKQ